MALGTHTKFQLEILTINVISGIVYFRKIILEISWNISETTNGDALYIFARLFWRSHETLVKQQMVMQGTETSANMVFT